VVVPEHFVGGVPEGIDLIMDRTLLSGSAPVRSQWAGDRVFERLELLNDVGSGSGDAFQMPFGTNHKFNGYADAFLATPAGGLRDAYVWAGTKLPWDLNAKVGYHHSRSDSGGDAIGNEIDAALGKKLGAHTSALLKAAHLNGDGSQPDITRASFQIETPAPTIRTG
jgi:hypothetical protein